MARNVTKGRITVTRFAGPRLGDEDRTRVRIDLAHVDCQIETKGVALYIGDARALLAALQDLLIESPPAHEGSDISPRCGALSPTTPAEGPYPCERDSGHPDLCRYGSRWWNRYGWVI